MLGQDRFNNGAFRQRFTGLRWLLALGLVVVHMKAQDVQVFDGVGDGVGVELLLEDVFGSPIGRLFSLDLLVTRVLLKDGGTRKTKELRVGKKFLDGLVVLPKLGAVALVEDEDDALLA